MSYTTDDLLEEIKTQAMIPENQITLSDEDLLRLADKEVRRGIVPYIMAVREDYFVRFKDVEVDGQKNQFPIPKRSIGFKLKDLTIVTNPESTREEERSLPVFAPEDVPNRSYRSEGGYQGFFFRGNSVIVTPPPSGSSTVVRLYYFQRPNRLVLPTASARVAAVNTSTNVVSVTAVPTTFITGLKFDLTSASEPYDNLDQDVVLTNINGADLTFERLPEGLEVGDYISLAEEAPVVQIPFDFIPMLVQRVVVKALEALGDSAGFNAARSELAKMEQEIMNLISPRVEGENKKIINRYGPLTYTSSRTNRPRTIR
jgi:hypothetical protein